MKHPLYLMLLLVLASCASPDLSDRLAEIAEANAPDRRTDRVEVELIAGELTGYTTSQAAEEQLRALATQHDLNYAARLLPAESLGEERYGIVKVSVANLRSRPGHSQELATQALLGTPIAVLDERDGWYLVRTPDRYLAWLESGAFKKVSRLEVDDWIAADDLGVYQLPFAETVTAPEGSNIIADPSLGGLVHIKDTEGDWSEVMMPDGETGYNRRLMLDTASAWMAPNRIDTESVLERATALAGRPYLWGGTSAKGLDCSGFTKMAYYMNGFIIPRDASQQVHVGEEVALDEELSNLRRGDLLFFGTLRDDGSQRVTHVGFYMGEGRLLHSGADNGRITENNLIAGRPYYNAERRKTLLRAKRIEYGSRGVHTVAEAFAALIAD